MKQPDSLSPDTLADKQRDSLNTRKENFTENYFDLRERSFF